MSSLPIAALSSENIVGIVIVGGLILLVVLLLRNRVRCPKDHQPMRLYRPEKGKHYVYRCKACGHQQKLGLPTRKR